MTEEKRYIDESGFSIVIFRDPQGIRILTKAEGAGEELVIPVGVERLFAYCIQCPNLKKVYIPKSVKIVDMGVFGEFDSRLEIFCEAAVKPEEYFEGEYYESFKENYEKFTEGYYGSWLSGNSVKLYCMDAEGRFVYGASRAGRGRDILGDEDRPKVYWGYRRKI